MDREKGKVRNSELDMLKFVDTVFIPLYSALIRFLSIFPTEVLGIASTKSIREGIAHLLIVPFSTNCCRKFPCLF